LPTYSYSCKKCGHEFDVFHGIKETPRVKCAACGSARCERLIGTGAGIIFRGGGFYETDFKQKKGAPPSEAGAKAEGGDGKKTGDRAASEKAATKKESSKHGKSTTAAKD